MPKVRRVIQFDSAKWRKLERAAKELNVTPAALARIAVYLWIDLDLMDQAQEKQRAMRSMARKTKGKAACRSNPTSRKKPRRAD